MLRDYYKVIKKCRKSNDFFLNEIEQEDFISAIPPQVFKNLKKNTNGELIS